MSRTPTFSVVVPHYNAARTIERALRSVLAQTCRSFEVVLVDDASTDETIGLVGPFLRDSRFRLLRQRANLGLAQAMNRGLEHACGEFLVQLDADDWLEGSALDVLHEWFQRNPNVGAIYGAPIIHEYQGSRAEGGGPVFSPAECLTYRRVQAPRAYRVSSLRAAGGWDITDAYGGRYFEDRNTLARVAAHYPVLYCDQRLYHVDRTRPTLSLSLPLQTGSAKVAILWGHAQALDCDCRYTFNGRAVHGTWVNRDRQYRRLGWSVIVPRCGDEQVFQRTIRSWLQSDLCKRTGELVIVEYGGTEDSRQRLLCDGSHVRVVSCPHIVHRGAAQDIGADNARFEMLYFATDNCLVHPKVLEFHERRHESVNGRAIVVDNVFGRYSYVDADSRLDAGSKKRLLDMIQFDPSFPTIAAALATGARQELVPRDASSLWSAARRYAFTKDDRRSWGEVVIQHGVELHGYEHAWLAVREGGFSIAREALLALGGFDPRFSRRAAWDLGIRAQKAGVNIVCAPEAEGLRLELPICDTLTGVGADDEEIFRATHSTELNRLQSENAATGVRFRATDAQLGDQSRNHLPVPACSSATSRGAIGNCVGITFCGTTRCTTTEPLLAALADHDVKATFFVPAALAERDRLMCRRLVELHHEVALDGWTVVRECRERGEMSSDLRQAVAALERAMGVRPRFILRPQGAVSASTQERVLRELSLTGVCPDVLCQDWGDLSEREMVKELAVAGIAGKSILLDAGSHPSDILIGVVRWIVGAAKDAGIEPRVISDFFNR